MHKLSKFIKSGLFVSLLAYSLNATSNSSELATHKGIYLEPKLTFTLGETVSHGTSKIEGASGYGLGFDLGYSFSEYFALEIDATYSKSDVKETTLLGEITEDKATFYSYGINTVLTYPMSHHFILLGKLGYGKEHEDLGDLHISGSEHGAVWAAGIEYLLNSHVEVSLEYEGADIRSARGDSVQLGLIYKF